MSSPRQWLSRLPRGTLRLVFLIGLGNALTYAFQAASGRVLGPEAYGKFSGLFSTMAVITVATSAVQTKIAAATALAHPVSSGGDKPFGYALRLGLQWTSVTVVLVAVSPLLGRLWGIGTLPIIVMALFPIVSIVTSVVQGVLQGTRRFETLYGFSLVQAMTKLVALAVVAALGLGMTTLLFLLIVLSGALSLIVLLNDPRSRFVQMGHGVTLKNATVSTVAFWALLYSDIILAPQVVGPTSGDYAALATLAKAGMWIPMILCQMAFPAIVGRNQTAAERDTILRRMIVMSLATSAALGAVLLVVGPSLMQLFYGDDFTFEMFAAIPLVTSVVVWSVNNALVMANLAAENKHQPKALAVLAGVGLIVPVGLPGSSVQLAWYEVSLALVVCVVLSRLFVNSRKMTVSPIVSSEMERGPSRDRESDN